MRLSYVVLVSICAAILHADPRHDVDPRCAPAAVVDKENELRTCSHCTFAAKALQSNATVKDCIEACCGDWNCQSFQFLPYTPGMLNGLWINHDSLRGNSGVVLQQVGNKLTAISQDPARAYWSAATGVLVNATFLYLCFDCSPGHTENNRTGVLSPDGLSINLERLPFDPANFTQVFSKETGESSLCFFMDDIPPAQPVTYNTSLISGVRAFLPPQSPPFPKSTYITDAVVHSQVYMGVNGDEFPITWARDGNQYTGAGDNTQPSPGINISYSSPMSFFRVRGTPLDASYPDRAFDLMGDPYPVSKTPRARASCPGWSGDVYNLKSSGVLDINGTMYWAVSCFNYGDDPAFNRQRYGPAWITTSFNNGISWIDANAPVFEGRFGAPRFVQFGQSYSGAVDDYVYVYFPGTENNAAFFECNDAIWLARVRVAQLYNRSAYEFYVGVDAGGLVQWSSDDSIAQHIFEWPLHTSVQQVNYNIFLKRFIFANWVWISMDGNPRPDHSPDERNDRTARQRTMLTLFEAPTPWGPFSVFYEDDNWQYEDGSSGAYTPVFPPAWIDAKGFWMVSTQCCGTPQYPPTNHYSFNAQRVDVNHIV